MRVSKMFRFRSDKPSVIIAALVAGVVLSVAGSVLATSIGDSVSVTSTLSVTGASTLTGNVGVATSTAGSVFSIQGAANFRAGTSTLYSSLLLPLFSATSTSATSTLSTGGLTVGDTQFVVQQNSGRVGIGTSTPGSFLSIHGVANFAQDATSTVYSRLTFPIFMATSTTATSTLSTGGFVIGTDQFVVQQSSGRIGVGTTTPGSLLSVQGVANFTTGATSTIYSTVRFPIFAATSTSATSTLSTGGLTVGDTQFVVQQNSGSIGIGTSTPGSLLSVQDVANFVNTTAATSTIYTKIRLPSFQATSTIATSSFSNGLLVGTDAGSFGLGTTTPIKTLSAAGDALIGAGANGTSTVTVNASGAGIGSCIQMRAASTSDLYRIYLGRPIAGSDSTGYNNAGLIIELGLCR